MSDVRQRLDAYDRDWALSLPMQCLDSVRGELLYQLVARTEATLVPNWIQHEPLRDEARLLDITATAPRVSPADAAALFSVGLCAQLDTLQRQHVRATRRTTMGKPACGVARRAGRIG